MIQAHQSAKATLKAELPPKITVAQQGHTGAKGTHLRIDASGFRNEKEAAEAIAKFVTDLFDQTIGRGGKVNWKGVTSE